MIMAEKKTKEEKTGCPVGTFFKDFEGTFGKKSKFFKHMTQSKVEFLKGIRSLLDERIDHLEKRSSGKSGNRMTKIKVE
jgi:hypothetical protein